jgi:hypothetical protein
MLSTSNKAVHRYLTHCLAGQKLRAPIAATIHEFEDCRYLIESSNEVSDAATLSFSHSYELSEAAHQHASEAFNGVAEIAHPPQQSYQITLKVQLAALRCPTYDARHLLSCKQHISIFNIANCQSFVLQCLRNP